MRGRFSGECPEEDLSDGVRYIYEDIDEEYEGAGAGYVLSLNLYSPLRPYGDMSAICGTAVTYYGDDCTPKYLAPITGGSIEISESGDNYHIKLTDCVTNTGYKVIFDYEGPISPFNDGRTPTTEGSAAPVIATAGNAAAMTAPWTPGE